MAIKYQIEYHNKYKITIDVPNYDGEIIHCKGVGQKAFELEYEEDMHIMSSKANIAFYTDVDIYDLQTANDLEVLVEVFRDNLLYWRGYLIADGLKQYDRQGLPSEVNIIATDGLNNTKEMTFTLGSASPIEMPEYMSEFNTPLHYLIRCLQLINNELPIRWSVSTKSVLDINKDVFCGLISLNRTEFLLYEGVDAFFVLENILKSFNLKIMQSNGYWYVYNELDEFLGYEYNNGVVTMYQEEVVNQPEYFLTNNNTFEVRKGIGKVVISYNPIKDMYVIPNGSFNETSSGRPVDWKSDKGYLMSDSGDENRISFRLKDDLGREERSVILDGSFVSTPQIYYFESESGNSYIPIDGHNLYKHFTFGFRMMPFDYPTLNPNEEYIDWLDTKPFSIQVKYSILRNGVVTNYYLNENGYWQRSTGEIFRISNINRALDETYVDIKFEGIGDASQSFTISYFAPDVFGGTQLETMRYTLDYDYMSLDDTLNALMLKIDNSGITATRESLDTIRFYFDNISGEIFASAYVLGTAETTSNTWINFIVDNAINGDVIEYQFQSKASQGKIELPDPGDTHQIIPDGRGYLSFAFKQKNAVTTIVDELKFSFEEATETYTLKINDNDSEEFELRIGSSFTGFDLTSYSLDFSTTDFYMMFSRNGVVATLPEHYGRDFLQLNARPRRVWTGQMKGEIKPYQMTTIRGINFVPLHIMYNTETNETSGSWIEFTSNNLENLEINITNGKTND